MVVLGTLYISYLDEVFPLAGASTYLHYGPGCESTKHWDHWSEPQCKSQSNKHPFIINNRLFLYDKNYKIGIFYWTFAGTIVAYVRKGMFISICSSRQRYFLLFSSLLLVSSADNICKKFGSWRGPTKRRTWSGEMIQTVWHSDIIPERCFRIKWFWKKNPTQQTTQKHEKYSECK